MKSEVKAKTNLKWLAARDERFSPGHRMCAGCSAPVIVRTVLNSIDDPVVVGNATGCLEVATTIYPYTAWRVPWIHSAFENAAATISGVESMYRSLVRQNKIPDRKIKFIVFGGDGGTYDIGLQSLSGALERGHSFLYICYDNQGYMNTGIQRSGATPHGAATTTSPAGVRISGKPHYRKDLTGIVAAHQIPYVAQASIWKWKDLVSKVQKALSYEGPSFINVYAPCHRGWRTETDGMLESSRLAVEACVWPLFEVEQGEWKLNYTPAKKLPIEQWLKTEGRFRHLLEEGNRAVLSELQEDVERQWEQLLKRCAAR